MKWFLSFAIGFASSSALASTFTTFIAGHLENPVGLDASVSDNQPFLIAASFDPSAVVHDPIDDTVSNLALKITFGDYEVDATGFYIQVAGDRGKNVVAWEIHSQNIYTMSDPSGRIHPSGLGASFATSSSGIPWTGPLFEASFVTPTDYINNLDFLGPDFTAGGQLDSVTTVSEPPMVACLLPLAMLAKRRRVQKARA